MRIFFVILLSVFSCKSFAQIKADDVRNEKDMEKFLDQYYFKGNRNDTAVVYQRVSDSTYFYSFDSATVKYFETKKYPKWVRRDFNNDKKTDLIFCGLLNDVSVVLAFMSTNNTYSILKLSNRSDQWGTHFISTDKKDLVVGVCDIDAGDDTSYNFSQRCRIDTVTWWKNMFIDRDFIKGAFLNIDTIRFSFFSAFPRNRDELTFSRTNQEVSIIRMETIDTAYNIG